MTSNEDINKLALEACQAIVDVRDCMMFQDLHATWLIDETLEKHGVASIQLLAKKAQDLAAKAVGRELKEGKTSGRKEKHPKVTPAPD